MPYVRACNFPLPSLVSSQLPTWARIRYLPANCMHACIHAQLVLIRNEVKTLVILRTTKFAFYYEHSLFSTRVVRWDIFMLSTTAKILTRRAPRMFWINFRLNFRRGKWGSKRRIRNYVKYLFICLLFLLRLADSPATRSAYNYSVAGAVCLLLQLNKKSENIERLQCRWSIWPSGMQPRHEMVKSPTQQKQRSSHLTLG